MTTIDMVIVALYAVGLFGLAQWVSRDSGQAKPPKTTFSLEELCLGGRSALADSSQHLSRADYWAVGPGLCGRFGDRRL